jgi:hypothetical protein
MQGLLLRLSGLDADAENAVRVIGFFDALMTGKADLNTLLRSTATLAECPVGMEAAGRGLVLRADPSGTIDVQGPPAGAQIRMSGDASFWLSRPAGTLAFDEMMLERFALAGSLLLDRTVNALPSVGDPALVELVVSASAGIAERSRALHLLGIDPTASLRVAVSTRMPSAPARSAPVGSHVVTLLTTDDSTALLDSARPGTDVCGAVITRSVYRKLDDATVTLSAGWGHYYGDKRMPVVGAGGMIAAALTLLIALSTGQSGAAFFTLDGQGRVAVRVSSNLNPAGLTIEVPAPF